MGGRGDTIMEYDVLKLENQLCFPLYACSREIVKKYTPLLAEIGLTYTQYIVMLVLWEQKKTTAKELGERLHLDSGTLTPLLKRLEANGLVSRFRAPEDERNLMVALTGKGGELQAKAADIPGRIGPCINLSPEEAVTLYSLLYKILDCV
ncbi:organic hydroperoxide resistance transcriptional regulator [Christensenella minuta]|uniref:Organic hydroperoxide resistance transcriptional regulator n=2 Tax=Christensenella minuta TaxID=626937 RepID=A0A136Q5M2_9FIRM|nr:organic hydroperoxide resistance transcriptional regulator [Christensenella minuta]